MIEPAPLRFSFLPAAARIVAGMVSCIALATASAQQLSPPDPAHAPGEPAAEAMLADPPPMASAPKPAPEMNRLVSDALVRAAIQRLRINTNPQEDDYRLVARVFRLAQRHHPGDEELVRLELQAWLSAGDDAMVTDANNRLIAMDPLDTVAQLRLLTSRLRRLQNADLRLAAFDRLLSDQGASIDASIRSRLALDAALLARETGDEAGFVERLTFATTLDGTNKDAAALYSTYFLDRSDDPQERVDLLANVVLADPNDMSAHTNLARELFRQGAYVAADRFLKRAGEIAASTGIEPGIDDLLERYMLTWMTEGDQAAEKAVEGLVNAARSLIDREMRVRESQGIETLERPEPLIPAELEMVNLAIFWSRGDATAAAESARKIQDRMIEEINAIDSQQPPHDQASPQQRAIGRADRALRMLTARLWSGWAIAEAEAEIDPFVNPESPFLVDREAEHRLRGLLAIHKGEFEEADRFLRTAGDDPVARLALGMLAEKRGDQPGAMRAYAKVALESPHRLVGCAAKKRIEHLLGAPLAPTPAVRGLEAWSKSFAPWLDEMTTNPTAFMILTAEHVSKEIDVFDRLMVRIRLRNVSRLPMSVGPDLTFNSRLLMSPRVVVKAEDVSAIIEPEAVELDRRLRLMPGETLSTKVWCTKGSLGSWLERFGDKAATVRWQVIQGYRVDEQRRFAPGTISVTAQSDIARRNGVDPIPEVDAIVDGIGSAQGREFLEFVLRAVIAGGTQSPTESDQTLRDRRERLARALADRFPSLTSEERAYCLATTARVQFLNDSRVLIDVAQDDPSPFVQAALIVDGYREVDDPGLLRQLEHPDPEIREMARAARARLVVPSAGETP